MIRQRAPIKRSRILVKPRKRRVFTDWKGEVTKVVEDAKGIKALRRHIYERSHGICEVRWPYERKKYSDRTLEGTERCPNFVGWLGGEMHHVFRSDDCESVLFVCHDCHTQITGTLRFGANA